MFLRRCGYSVAGAVALVCALWLAPVMAEYALGPQKPVTDAAASQYTLYTMLLWAIGALFVIVLLVLLYTLFVHRKSRGVTPARFDRHATLELTWAIIPLVIVIAIAIPATQAFLKMENGEGAEMDIHITGKQWQWEYNYPDHGLRFTSAYKISGGAEAAQQADYLLAVDNEMVIPKGVKIRLLFTSVDVIHSWWIPKFGARRDAVPGYVNEMWIKVDEEGVYRGQCAKICGKSHSAMPIVVRVVNREAFRQWASERKSRMLSPDAPATPR